MGIGIFNLASDVCRKYGLSMMGLTIGKKKPKKYVDASTMPTVLTLFAVSDQVNADISITGSYKVNYTTTSTDLDLTIVGKSGGTTFVTYPNPHNVVHITDSDGTDYYVYNNDDMIGSYYVPNFGLITNIKILENEGGSGKTVEGYPVVFVRGEIEDYLMVTYPDESTKFWTEDGEIEAPETITEINVHTDDSGVEWTSTDNKYVDGKKIYYKSSEDGAWKQETHTINADGSWTEHVADSNGTNVYIVKTLEDNGDKPITATGSLFVPNFGLLDNIQAEFGDLPPIGTAKTSEGYPVMFVADNGNFFIVSHDDGSKKSYTFDNGEEVDKVVLSGDVGSSIVEGSHRYYTTGDLHGFDTGSLSEASNSSEDSTSMTGAELLATTSNTNLTDTTNLSGWPVEESNSMFEYMENTTFATFDTFVEAKSKSGTYKLDGVVSNIEDFAVFTPAYQYDFLDRNPYFSLRWENDAGELLEVVERTSDLLTPASSSTVTLILQDENDLAYGGSTDVAATLVFEETNSGDVTGDEVTQVVATDESFKVFEDILSTIGNYSVGDRVINITYVPVIDKDRLSIGDLTGAFSMEQVLATTNELGIDMIYNDGLIYTIKDQQGIFGSLSLVLPGSYTDSYYSTPFFSGFDNVLKGWAYSIDNTDPDTIALNLGEIATDIFIVNVSDGIHTSSMEIQISITGSDHKLGGYRGNILQDDLLQGTDADEYFTPLEGADVINAMSGNDIINLHAYNSIWTSGYVAKNISNIDSIGTGRVISLEGMNRFSDVIDGGDDIDVLNLTDGNDAFFIDDVYSGHHSSLVLSSTTQGVNSTARIVNLEVINAGAGDDIVDLTSANFVLNTGVTINGEAGDDVLWGSNGDDIINGGDGDDIIFGGAGNDTLTGGSGSDIFQFTVTSAGNVITDFDVNNDSIELYYRKDDDLTNLFISNETLIWQTGNPDENGSFSAVSINLSTSISKTDSAIINNSLNTLDSVRLIDEVQLFKEALSVFDVLEPSDTDIKVATTPSIDTGLLAIGDLANALTMDPMLYLETSLGTNVMHANGITYYIEDQQGVYGSFGFGLPLEGGFKLSDISTGNTDLRSSIDPAGGVSIDRYAVDYATMHLSNGLNSNWPTWYYVLDNDDVETINATDDSTHIDLFTVKATNGVDVVSQQIEIDIFEDIGLPFDNNTLLGKLQEGFPVNEDESFTMLDYTRVSVNDLNNFDSFIAFVEIV